VICATVLWLDCTVGYNSENRGVGDTAYVIDSNFLWEDMDNYIRWETLSEISGPRDGAKSLTNAADVFEKIF